MIGVIAMQVAAALSVFASLAMMIVILRLNLAKRLFMKLVFYVAFSDFGSAMAMVIGGTKTGSAACYYQGIVNNYFTLSSILWTMVIGYEVHLVIWYGRVQTNLTYFAIFNWTLPLLLSLVPLSTSTYGNDDGTPGWCFVNSKPNFPDWIDAFWYIVSFYFWIYFAIFYLFYVTISAAYKLYFLQRGMITSARVVVEKIMYYPAIVVLCWVVSSVIDIADVAGYEIQVDETNPISVFFTYMLPNLQGFLSGLIFFYSNQQIVEEFMKEIHEHGWFALPLITFQSNENSIDGVPGGRTQSSASITSKSFVGNIAMVLNPSESTVDTSTSSTNTSSIGNGGPASSGSIGHPSGMTMPTKEDLELLEHIHVSKLTKNRRGSSSRLNPVEGEEEGRVKHQSGRRGSARLSFLRGIGGGGGGGRESTTAAGGDNGNLVRSSDIEMNRPSSIRQPSNMGMDYGAWDENLGNESFDASNQHYYGNNSESYNNQDPFRMSNEEDVNSYHNNNNQGGNNNNNGNRRFSTKATTMLNTITEEEDGMDRDSAINPMQQA